MLINLIVRIRFIISIMWIQINKYVHVHIVIFNPLISLNRRRRLSTKNMTEVNQ